MNYKKIGAVLKKEREQKGLSYQQVFEVTRIQPSILKSIEEGKPQISEVFFKTFIKTYVKFLGLDLSQVLKQGNTKKSLKEENQVELKKPASKPFRIKLSFYIVVSFLVLVMFLNTLLERSFFRSDQGLKNSEDFNPESSDSISETKSKNSKIKNFFKKTDDSELLESDKSSMDTEESLEGEKANSNLEEEKLESSLGPSEEDSDQSKSEGNTYNNQEVETEDSKSQEGEASTLNQKKKGVSSGNSPESQDKASQSLWNQIRSENFQHELMINSLEPIKIYFKIDQQSTVTKELSPSVWFVIKAKESLYIRFDEKVDQVEMFYNGVKWNFSSSRFFEKTFKTVTDTN